MESSVSSRWRVIEECTLADIGHLFASPQTGQGRHPPTVTDTSHIQHRLETELAALREHHRELEHEVSALETSWFNLKRRKIAMVTVGALTGIAWVATMASAILSFRHPISRELNYFIIGSKTSLIALAALLAGAYQKFVGAERKRELVRATHRKEVEEAARLQEFVSALTEYDRSQPDPTVAASQIRNCTHGLNDLAERDLTVLPTQAVLVSRLIVELYPSNPIHLKFLEAFRQGRLSASAQWAAPPAGNAMDKEGDSPQSEERVGLITQGSFDDSPPLSARRTGEEAAPPRRTPLMAEQASNDQSALAAVQRVRGILHVELASADVDPADSAEAAEDPQCWNSLETMLGFELDRLVVNGVEKLR